ncbi:MAG: DUF1553 domain-containing protein [Acidobacteria bacterium]|nr:DUF1553 domain-containing protein [Acidobacteriota bacterium]
MRNARPQPIVAATIPPQEAWLFRTFMRSARLLLAVFAFAATAAAADASTAAGEALFDAQIQPLLAARCASCHGAKLPTSGLSLGSREALLEGGNRGPSIVAGKPAESLLIQAVRQDGDLKMPPGGKLSADEIAALEKWVELGAPWSAKAVSQSSPEASHWSFQPIRRPEPPAPVWPDKVRNAIDRFVQARLAKDKLTPSPEADRATLIRRVSLDLTGLLPTPEDVLAFEQDAAPDAYAKMVERYLASPHYGERWGRHWLDIAHYADSNGYNLDGEREVWRYRDWVIRALNDDKPFDEFVIEQIAGDLLPHPTQDQLIATGFHRNTLINLEGGIDFEQYRVEAVVDRVDTIGQAFLGLTLGCARCHDHKYDPISQKEFYQFYAFYNSIDELDGEDGEAGRQDPFKPLLEFGTPEELAKRDVIRVQLEVLEKEVSDYETELAKSQAEWETGLSKEWIAKLGDEDQFALAVPAEKRNPFQKATIARMHRKDDLGWNERQASIAAVRKRLPDLESTMVMRELPEPRESYIHLGGDFLRHGVTVQPDTLKLLPAMDVEGSHRPTRLDLAKWLMSGSNPLTARVSVNRVWQRYFGLGLVETENDFGTQGSAPSHPELLDWLASEFRDKGWSQKDLHRLILTSHTYRQASLHRDDSTEIDPRNRLLSRQNRLRLEAEAVRDAALSASGLLTAEIGGPSVHPPQPDGASKLGQMQRDWVADTDKERFRRGMYTYFWRSSPHPGLMVFDAPDSTNACTRRPRSNTPLQALTLLNDTAYYEFAQGLAKRVLTEGPAAGPQRLDYAFRLCVARPPDATEREELAGFLAEQLDAFQTKPEAARPIADTPELAAWTAVGRVLLNLDEFITRE